MISNKHISVLFFLMLFTYPAFAGTPPVNQDSKETTVDLIKQKIVTFFKSALVIAGVMGTYHVKI